MEARRITEELINRYKIHLHEEEKSKNTTEKYVRDVKRFMEFAGENEITKETVIAYKQSLIDSGYAVKSINSMLASINSLFVFLGWYELRVKSLKMQQQVFCPEEKELTREEYERLCSTALKKHNERLCLIIQTICSTGIRVSELQFITAEAVRRGETAVSLKGKTRVIFITKALQKKLLRYITEQKIESGSVFVTRSGKAVNRVNIWREMKSLCAEADVNPNKVFPHNLHHLFARAFYAIEKDIAKLADILGHSSINTTRLYIVSSGTEHRKRMERMCLVILSTT